VPRRVRRLLLHFLRGRNVEVFRPAAKVALIVLVPVSCVNLWFGSHFGILVTSSSR